MSSALVRDILSERLKVETYLCKRRVKKFEFKGPFWIGKGGGHSSTYFALPTYPEKLCTRPWTSHVDTFTAYQCRFWLSITHLICSSLVHTPFLLWYICYRIKVVAFPNNLKGFKAKMIMHIKNQEFYKLLEYFLGFKP